LGVDLSHTFEKATNAQFEGGCQIHFPAS